MRNFSRVIFTLLLMILFVEVLIIAPEQLNYEDKLTRLEDDKPESEAEQSMWKVHLVESQGGARDWELFAESAEGYTGKTGGWNLNKVKAIFYSKNGERYVVRGDKGKIDTDKRDMEIIGKVSTISSTGYEFFTEFISYTAKDKILKTPDKVQMKGPKDSQGLRMTLSGFNMTTLLESSLMQIDKDVVAQRPLKEGRVLMIKSQKAEFMGRNTAARFANGVEIVYDKMSMKGPEAFFSYQTGSDIPSSIFVNGGVQVTGDSKFATAENLKIDFNSDKYIFRGSPKVVQNGDSLMGEEIIFLEGGKRVKVERVKAQVEDTRD